MDEPTSWTVIRTWHQVQATSKEEAIAASRLPQRQLQPTVRVMRGDIPDETDYLLRIIDTLWGELPVEIVLRLEKDSPEILEACKAVHELVGHE